MPKEVMRRKAFDNEYMHKDFHLALNNGLLYIEKKYGSGSVIEYLEDFTRSFHAPLKKELIKKGLPALKQYFERMYEAEKGKAEISLTDNELKVHIETCPALEHIRKNGAEPSDYYSETSASVYRTLCEGTPYGFRMDGYDPVSGRSDMIFYRRPI